jgi:hypothetical protein
MKESGRSQKLRYYPGHFSGGSEETHEENLARAVDIRTRT